MSQPGANAAQDGLGQNWGPPKCLLLTEANRAVPDRPLPDPGVGDRLPLAIGPDLPLCEATLQYVGPEIIRPSYDRSKLQTGVVFLGGTSKLAGGLVIQCIEDGLNQAAIAGDESLTWGVSVVGFSPRADKAQQGKPDNVDLLRRQDGLYSIIECGWDHINSKPAYTPQVVGCVKDVYHAAEDNQRVLDQMAAPTTHVVFLSITAAKYFVGPNKQLNQDDPELKADLANPRSPQTALGMAVESLYRRMKSGAGPVSVISCDNLPAQGPRVLTNLIEYAELNRHVYGDALIDYIETHVCVPSVMVDRICPEPQPGWKDIAYGLIGLRDLRPLFTEPDWARMVVIETSSDPRQRIAVEHFIAHNPFLGVKNVIVVSSGEGHRYEVTKQTMVNAPHVLMTSLERFYGNSDTPVHLIMQDPRVGGAVKEAMAHEIRRSVATIVPEDLDGDDYLDKVIGRFSNGGLGDTIARISKGLKDRMYRLGDVIFRLEEQGLLEAVPADTVFDGIAAFVITSVLECRHDGSPFEPRESAKTLAELEDIRRLSHAGGLEDPKVEHVVRQAFEVMCDRGWFGGSAGQLQSFRDGGMVALKRLLSKMPLKHAIS